MKTNLLPRLLLIAMLLGAGLSILSPGARSNPPAPYNLVYGVVRDKYGTPFTTSSATIVFETPAGAMITASVIPGYAPGVNYQMKIPIDSGQTPDLYRPTAQIPTVPFKLYVVINNVTNLPIEMTVNYATLGQPGQRSRIDLTLGVDSNGDGIPDSWEFAFLAALGTNVPLSSLNGNLVLTGDGLTLRQQYLFGIYPFNPSAPCLVTFAGFNGASADLQFPTITGRYYSVLASSDTKNWTASSFHLASDAPGSAPRTWYYASTVGTAEVLVVPATTSGQSQFYRVLVQ